MFLSGWVKTREPGGIPHKIHTVKLGLWSCEVEMSPAAPPFIMYYHYAFVDQDHVVVIKLVYSKKSPSRATSMNISEGRGQRKKLP